MGDVQRADSGVLDRVYGVGLPHLVGARLLYGEESAEGGREESETGWDGLRLTGGLKWTIKKRGGRVRIDKSSTYCKCSTQRLRKDR